MPRYTWDRHRRPQNDGTLSIIESAPCAPEMIAMNRTKVTHCQKQSTVLSRLLTWKTPCFQSTLCDLFPPHMLQKQCVSCSASKMNVYPCSASRRDVGVVSRSFLFCGYSSIVQLHVWDKPSNCQSIFARVKAHSTCQFVSVECNWPLCSCFCVQMFTILAWKCAPDH